MTVEIKIITQDSEFALLQLQGDASHLDEVNSAIRKAGFHFIGRKYSSAVLKGSEEYTIVFPGPGERDRECDDKDMLFVNALAPVENGDRKALSFSTYRWGSSELRYLVRRYHSPR